MADERILHMRQTSDPENFPEISEEERPKEPKIRTIEEIQHEEYNQELDIEEGSYFGEQVDKFIRYAEDHEDQLITKVEMHTTYVPFDAAQGRTHMVMGDSTHWPDTAEQAYVQELYEIMMNKHGGTTGTRSREGPK